jgi:hypothetical protein
MVLVNWVLTKPVPAPLWVFAPLLLPQVCPQIKQSPKLSIKKIFNRIANQTGGKLTEVPL